MFEVFAERCSLNAILHGFDIDVRAGSSACEGAANLGGGLLNGQVMRTAKLSPASRVEKFRALVVEVHCVVANIADYPDNGEPMVHG